LLARDLIAHLDNPEILLRLFRRPSTNTGFDGYLTPLTFPSGFKSESERDRELGGQLIRALYGGQSPYTVLPVERYSAAESAFLSIWRIQWPGLRQRFTFCTGVRSRRSLEGDVFNLQAALLRDVRRLDRGSVPLTIIERSSATPPLEGWIHIALAAYMGLDNALTDFFSKLGFRLPGEISLFRPIVQTFAMLNRVSTSAVVRELIDFAANEYPGLNDGSDYKLAVFANNVTGLPETELIKELAVTEKYASFDGEFLGMCGRAAALWPTEEQAWTLIVSLLTGKHNTFGEQAILGLTSAMPANLLREAVDSSPEILIEIIRREPRFASSGFLWSKPAQHRIVAQALSVCRDQLVSRADEIIRTALESNADPTYPSLIEVFGPASVACVLDWLDESQTREVPPGWRRALSSRSTDLLEWLIAHPAAHRETASFVLLTIDLDTAPGQLLIRVLPSFMDKAGADDQGIMIAARVLQFSLRSYVPECADLAAIVFDVVYNAAVSSRLSNDAWYQLLPFLPPSGWWQEWDRCERLRKGIAEKFRSEQWPSWQLVRITNDDRIFVDIIAELRQRRSGRRVLAAAAEATDASARRALMLNEP
jgi:hypothetical protein